MHIAVGVLVAIGVIAITAGILIRERNGATMNAPLASPIPPNVAPEKIAAKIEVTATLMRNNQEISFDEPLADGDDVWLKLEADRAGTFYLFRLSPGTVERYGCGPDDCEPIPYDTASELLPAQCKYSQGQELRGWYCVVAVLLQGDSVDICNSFNALGTMGGADEDRITDAVLDIMENRPDFIGCDVVSYVTR